MNKLLQDPTTILRDTPEVENLLNHQRALEKVSTFVKSKKILSKANELIAQIRNGSFLSYLCQILQI